MSENIYQDRTFFPQVNRALLCYLVYKGLEPVLGEISISITVVLSVVAASSTSALFRLSASSSLWVLCVPEVNCCSVGAGGDADTGEEGKEGEAGEAGEAGETGDGGDGGDVGEGGVRGGDGNVLLA